MTYVIVVAMRHCSAVVVAALAWGGCDSDKAAPAGPVAEETPAAAPANGDAPGDGTTKVAAGDAKVQPDPNRPPKDMEDPDKRPAPDAAAAKPPVDPAPGPDAKLTTVEAGTPATKAGKVVHKVGIELAGGRFAPVLTPGCELPCWKPLPMWPKTADDTTVDFTLRRAARSKDAGTPLGTYRVASVPKPPPGTHSEVIVGLGIVDGSIAVHAKLRDTGKALPLSKVDP